VNGTFVPLNHALKSGDVVEILTQKNKKPSEGWLGFIKTSVAREHVKASLNKKHGSFVASHTPTKAELRIAVKDRLSLLKDISGMIAHERVNIIGFTILHPPGSTYPINRIECATTDKHKIEKLVLKLKQIEGVKEVSYKIL